MDIEHLRAYYTQRHKWESLSSFSPITTVTSLSSSVSSTSTIDGGDLQTSGLPCLIDETEPSPSHVDKRRPNLILLLPGELRNRIYRLVLTSPALLSAMRRAIAASHCSSYILPNLPVTAALLRSCKVVHAEATPIFYAENVFVAHSTLLTTLPHLIDPTRPVCAPGLGARIKKWYIHVRIDCDPRYSAEDLKRAFSGADELEVDASQAMFRSASMSVLLLFKGIRGVKSAKVGGSCPEGFARWLEHVMMSPKGVMCDEYDGDGIDMLVNGRREPFNPWSLSR